MLSNLLWWPWFGIGGGAVAPEYNPMGDSSPSLLDTGPIRRGRRRRREDILNQEEEEAILSVLIDI